MTNAQIYFVQMTITKGNKTYPWTVAHSTSLDLAYNFMKAEWANANDNVTYNLKMQAFGDYELSNELKAEVLEF